VKAGPRETLAFDLSGGVPCLDFVNTQSSENNPNPNERFWAAYEDLLAWALQAKILTGRQVAALRRGAVGRPSRARAVFRRACGLRAALFALFSASAAGSRPPDAAVRQLNDAIGSAFPHLALVHVLVHGRNAYRRGWRERPVRLERILWPVVDSAVELLASEDLARVRRCAADGCLWLFVDRSKNRSRRWCDMAVCGNRAKARRHRKAERAS